MEKEQIIQKVQTIIEKLCTFDSDQISADTNLKRDLGFDSFDIASLIFQVEETFNCNIPLEEFEKIETINDVANIVSTKKMSLQ